MRKKGTKNKLIIFDDSMLPVNRMTAERMEEIDHILAPRLDEALAQLRIEKPHLFQKQKTVSKT